MGVIAVALPGFGPALSALTLIYTHPHICSPDHPAARLLVGKVQNAHRIRETNHLDLCILTGKDGGEKGEGRKQCNFCRGQGSFLFRLEI